MNQFHIISENLSLDLFAGRTYIAGPKMREAPHRLRL